LPVFLAHADRQHLWQPVDNIPVPALGASSIAPDTGSVVELFATADMDPDLCLNTSCNFPDSTAWNGVQATSWDDGGAGGAFGFIDDNGQFAGTLDAGMVTHYQCPSS